MKPSIESPDMRDLISKLAVWPHGLGFLHLADLDTIAITLDVHPFVVAAAREALETDEGRARLIEEVRRARSRAGEKSREDETPRVAPDTSQGVKSEEDLVRAAGKHPLGLSFLVDGNPEAVAVTFDVHPDLVFRTRSLLEEMKSRSAGANGQIED